MMSGAAVLQGHGVNFVKLLRRRRHRGGSEAGLLDALLSQLSTQIPALKFRSTQSLEVLAVAFEPQLFLRAIYARILLSS